MQRKHIGNVYRLGMLDFKVFASAKSSHSDSLRLGMAWPAKTAVHAKLTSSTVKAKASSLLRELPRKLELPMPQHLSPVHSA